MEQENIILTGIPRSGTTLTCHLLNKLPQTVALHEPMNVDQFSKLESREVICQEIRQFFQEARASISYRKEVLSKNILGAVPDNPVGEARTQSGLRQSISPLGLIKVKKELDPGFLLVIKHPAAFTALLRELVLFFLATRLSVIHFRFWLHGAVWLCLWKTAMRQLRKGLTLSFGRHLLA
jgi:hypothetical protein